MIDTKSSRCVGSGACEAACPSKCISMEVSEAGEYRPVINKNRCVGCNACDKVCLINGKDVVSYPIGKAYFGWDKNFNVRKDSSSGGIANVIAKQIILTNGVVCGVGFDSNWTAKHYIITEANELNLVQGSKYVESKCGRVFVEIKNILRIGKRVLFIGLPCQVLALRTFLATEYSNLICVEVFCHGAPRIGIFHKYISYLERKYGCVKKINFRSKHYGWATASYHIQCEKTCFYQKHTKNIYHLMFGYHNSLRRSCFECTCRKNYRYADISLGDFWGIEKFYPQVDAEKGVSAIFVNSEKGKKIFEEISDDIYMEQCTKNEILEKNTWFIKNYTIPANQEQFETDNQHLSSQMFFVKYYLLYNYLYRIKRFISRG